MRFYSGSLGQSKNEYLEINPLPTYHFQSSMPTLSIPKLDKTLERYLRTQIALLSADEYQQTSAYATDLLNGLLYFESVIIVNNLFICYNFF